MRNPIIGGLRSSCKGTGGARPVRPPRPRGSRAKGGVQVVASREAIGGLRQVPGSVSIVGSRLEFTPGTDFDELAYDLDESQKEAQVPALPQYAEDKFLDQYHGLFGRLRHYTRDLSRLPAREPWRWQKPKPGASTTLCDT